MVAFADEPGELQHQETGQAMQQFTYGIERVEGWRPPGQAHMDYRLVIGGPLGTCALAVPARTLLDYRRLQRFVFAQIGAVVVVDPVEGRGREAQAVLWKRLLASLMRRPDPPPPDDAPAAHESTN